MRSDHAPGTAEDPDEHAGIAGESRYCSHNLLVLAKEKTDILNHLYSDLCVGKNDIFDF